jgi:DNA-binding response OmpR family regulator
LTAADYDPRLAFRGYQLGAVDYLTKPFDPWTLRSKVAAFAELWTAHAELTAQAGHYRALRHAVHTALELLEGGPPSPDPTQAAIVLRAARTPGANAHPHPWERAGR